MEDILSIIPPSAPAYTELLQAKNAYDAAIAAGQGEIAEAKANAVRGLLSQVQQSKGDPKAVRKLEIDFKRQVADLSKFGSQYMQEKPKAAAQLSAEDQAAKAAMIQAAQAGFGARVQEASSRGIQVPEQVVSSIQSLIGTGKTEEATKLTDQILGPVETPSQRDARIREARTIELAEKERKQQEQKNTEETQIIYSSLKRDQDELAKLQKEDISDVVGFTEPIARFSRRLAAEGGAEWAKQNELLRKKLINQTTGDIFEQARKIAPVTQTDLNWLKTVVVPSETDDASIWFDFLSKKKQVVDEKIAQIESNPDIASKLEIGKSNSNGGNKSETQSATDRLRAKRKNNGN